jgi:hypothetical protein
MRRTVEGLVVRLRARREEIVQAIVTRALDIGSEPVGERDAEYLTGLRATAAAGFDFILMGIEQGDAWSASASVPIEAVAQAQRAARNGVSLDTVLRRYMVGQALLWDYILEEAGRVDLEGALREMLQVHASLLDRLMMDVAREHVAACERLGRSREHSLAEGVRALLAGERVDGLDRDYALDGEHVGVIARGAGAQEALRALAGRLGHRLLSVPRGEETVWAWLGAQHPLQMPSLERALSAQASRADVQFAVGEPAQGLQGWRLTHGQAQAALLVALRKPRKLTRYADVALLASALKDEMLASGLIEAYLLPLDDNRRGGPVLRETLRAYLRAERNASSAAAALGVVRNTVDNRLRTVEERLGRTLHPCPAELEVALLLDELDVPTVTPKVSTGG